MKKKIIFEPTISETALLILSGLGKVFTETFWPHPYYHTFCKHTDRQSFRNTLRRLEKRKLIVGERRGGRVLYALSYEGEKLAKSIRVKLELAKSRRWDGKWRLLIFDIPEKVRGRRDFFRKELKSLGFFPLQKSVWVYPHRLPKDFLDLWDDFLLGKELILIESAKIEGDTELRSFFAL